MSSMQPIRIGLIGAGGYGSALASAVARSSHAVLTAVCDGDTATRERVASEFDATAFANDESLISADACDAVLVATPPATHAAICTRLLAANLHVLCEKPLTLSNSDASAMQEAAQDSAGSLAMATKFRHAADVIEAMRLIKDGRIGRLEEMEVVFSGRYAAGENWRSEPDMSGGGVLADNGPHALDLVAHFLGAVDEVHAVEARRVQVLPVDETVRITASTKSGALATCSLSWSTPRIAPYYATIYGNQGVIQLGWGDARIQSSDDKQWQSFGTGYDKSQSLEQQVNDFVAKIRGDESPTATLDQSIANVAMVAAAYESLWSGKFQSCQVEEATAEKTAESSK